MLVDRAKDLVAAHAPASAAAGVAAAVAVGGGVFLMTDDDPRPATTPPTAAGQDRAGSGAEKASKRGRDRRTGPERPSSGPDDRPGVSRSSSSSEPASVAPAPRPSADPGPGVAPGPDPTSGPGPQPGEPPTGSPPAETPPEADLRVTATSSSQQAAVHRVVVVVAGLAPGGSATLSVAGRGVTVVLTQRRPVRLPAPADLSGDQHPGDPRVHRRGRTRIQRRRRVHGVPRRGDRRRRPVEQPGGRAARHLSDPPGLARIV